MRHATLAALLLFGCAVGAAEPTPKQAAASKEALQELGEFVGDWKGSGSTKAKGREVIWSETLNVGWKFKGDDSWLALTVADGKFMKGGELKYDPVKKVYTLALTDPDKSVTNYDGKLVKGRLVMTAKDAKTNDVSRLTLYTVSGGSRMLVKAETQPKGRGLFDDQFAVAATKEGAAFAGGGKKPECLLTGGLGTIPVTFNGKTYYVCCSGCRDEFNSDPKKYVDAFEKKK